MTSRSPSSFAGGECPRESRKGAVRPASLAVFCASKRKRSCSGSARSSCSGSLPLARQQALERAALCPVKSLLPGMDLDASLFFSWQNSDGAQGCQDGGLISWGIGFFSSGENAAVISALRSAFRSSVLSFQKHIKEHHEEVRERPCPHPGCNKVFMIDRYLQRHVKLIHTGGSAQS